MQFRSHLRTRQNDLCRYEPWPLPGNRPQKPRLIAQTALQEGITWPPNFTTAIHIHTIADNCKGKLLKNITVVPKNKAKAPFRPEL